MLFNEDCCLKKCAMNKTFNLQMERGGGGNNWGKYFIVLIHVSEHVGHVKAIT
jgi:hypothetical protein